MLSIMGFVVHSLDKNVVKAFVLWANCLFMALSSIACGVAAAVWMPEAQAMWYSWCSLTGFASVACAIAFFAVMMDL